MSRDKDGRAQGGQGSSDGALVRATLRGELAAFEVLVGRYQVRATGLAYRLLNHRDQAVEVTQDAFLKAYEKLHSLSHPERFGSWLLKIVGNLALNLRRARALRKTVSLDAAADSEAGRGEMNRPDRHAASPAELASAGELEGLIQQAVEQLPEMQRMALVLFSMEKMPQKDVAGILGCSVEAVKWHVFTARKKLKDKLKDYL